MELARLGCNLKPKRREREILRERERERNKVGEMEGGGGKDGKAERR